MNNHPRWALTRLDWPRYELGLLLAIGLLGLVLRFYKLGEWSFWTDELRTITRAQASVLPATLLDQWWRPAISVTLIGWVLSLTGVTESSARLIPVLIGAASVPVLYFPIRGLWGRGPALTAALLLAVSPWHIYWSQNARFYTALMLLYGLASFTFFFIIEHDRPRYIPVFYGLLWLAVGERFLAVLLVPVIIAYLVLVAILPIEKPRGFRPRTIALLLAPGLAAVLFDLVNLITTGYSLVLASLELAVSVPVDDPLRLGVLIASHIGVPVVILCLFAGADGLRNRSRAALFTLLGAVVPVIVLLLTSPFIFTVDRYAFITLPSWVSLAAVAIHRLSGLTAHQGRLMVAGVLMVLLADAGSANFLYYQVSQGNRPDWRGAFEYVQERWQEGDVLVSTRAEVGAYYTGIEVTNLRGLNVNMVEQSGQRYWFVVDSEGVWHAALKAAWVEEHAVLVDFRYLRVWENIHLRTYLIDPAYPQAYR